MCDKCFEIDKKIEHYGRLASQVMDDLLSEGVGNRVAELTLEKLGLHPPDKSES